MAEINEYEFDDLPQDRKYQDIPEERWQRAQLCIDIFDVVGALTGRTSRMSPISCPFGHGVGSMDSRPSFNIYTQTNQCHCFGCPPKKNHFDTIQFVAQYLEINRYKALLWLEKNFELEPLSLESEDQEEDDEGGDDSFLLTVEDLKPLYFKKVRTSLKIEPNLANAQFYIKTYWDAMKEEDPTIMAKVVGRESVESLINKMIKRQKLYGK